MTNEPIDPFVVPDDDTETHICEYPGCTHWALACYLPDYISTMPREPDNWFCGTHASTHGYCSGCGDFWGGIESFEISGLCDMCRSELDHERELDQIEEWEVDDL